MSRPDFTNFADLTCDEFAETLPDFLEREVNESVREAMEAHALGCAGCGPLLADLRKLRIEAANLPPLEPPRDLWHGIADRIEAPVIQIGKRETGNGKPWGRRVWTGLAAAGLVAITATVTHEITRRAVASTQVGALPAVVVKPSKDSAPPAAVVSPTSESPSRQVAKSPSRVESPNRPNAQTPNRLVSNTRPSVEDTYASEIRRLRIIVNQRRGDLDSTTVAVIDKNLKIIDDAIASCRAALKKDPNSRFLMESLNDALDTKVQLLRTAAALPTRM